LDAPESCNEKGIATKKALIYFRTAIFVAIKWQNDYLAE
jgi:hypothetical protein